MCRKPTERNHFNFLIFYLELVIVNKGETKEGVLECNTPKQNKLCQDLLYSQSCNAHPCLLLSSHISPITTCMPPTNISIKKEDTITISYSSLNN